VKSSKFRVGKHRARLLLYC